MDREVRDKNLLNDFCVEFCSVVEKHARYIIVSGFIAIALGRTRGTEDIDIIMESIGKQRFLVLHNDLINNGFVCMQSDDPNEIYEDYLTKKASVRYTFSNKPLPEMEVKFAKDELDDYQLTNRTKIPLTGLNVWFSSIEANIAFKEEYLKSQKDIEDASHLRLIYKVNEDEINNIKRMIRKFK